MKHTILSIYDTATEAYMRPFTAQSKGQAVRMFEDEVNRPESAIGAHPEDYQLFQIGEFNDSTGIITNDPFKCLRKAHEVNNEPAQLKKVN